MTDSHNPVTVVDAEDNTLTLGRFTRARPCAYCKEDIHWMLTRYGNRMPFDAVALPSQYLTHGVGWIPGPWPVHGKTRIAMAPHEHYGQAKRSRVTHVATLHQCRGWIATRKKRGIVA